MKNALEWISELEASNEQAYRNIQKADVVTGLRDRIRTPTKIDQGNTSLCGAASLMYTLATKKPDVYARYVVELYTKGKAHLGKLKVAPGEDCRSYAATSSGGVHPVDWVALASLRDSENTFINYDEPSDEVGGITLPGALISWFRGAGFSKDTNDTSFAFCKGASCLEAAEKRRSHGHTVCLFISANMLSAPDTESWCPDHWVVLTSAVSITNGKASFKVFSWGGEQQVDQKVKTLCENFYGYISCSGT